MKLKKEIYQTMPLSRRFRVRGHRLRLRLPFQDSVHSTTNRGRVNSDSNRARADLALRKMMKKSYDW